MSGAISGRWSLLRVVNLIDFRGGYFTDMPSELMKDNELLKAENCHWREGLVKRNGVDTYSTSDWSGFEGIKGAIRVYINGAWTTIIALDDGSDVNFYQGNGTTFAAIDNTYDFTTGYNVEFAELDDHIVAVNGQDKPAVIYYDSGWTVENLETYDTRDWNIENCYAGQWDDSATPSFIDDTIAAYDDTADDFELSSAVANDGFYITCDYVFNKVVFKSAEQFDGTPTAEYAYWDGSSWQTFTPGTAPTWTDVAGDRTLEFDIPQNANGELLWQRYTEDDSLGLTGIPNRFILRVRFTFGGTPTGPFECDYLTLHNTQYLTLMLEDARPHTVYTHNGTMFMAERWILNFSPYQTVKGWKEGQVEFFKEGGRIIQQLISYRDVLVIFKENTIFTYNTTSLSDPVRSRPMSSVGAMGTRSAAVVGGLLMFVGEDGIYAWDGSKATKVSKHIQTDFDSLTKEDAAGINYHNEYMISFPTNEITLTVDPDTFRTDGVGNGQMSFFKFLNYISHKFIHNQGAGDNGYLLACIDSDPPVINRCDNGVADGSTPIVMTAQTRYFNFTGFQHHKFMGRFKPKIKEVSDSLGSSHTLTMRSEDGLKTASALLTVPVGTGYYSKDLSLPYSMDAKNISFEFYHAAAISAGLIGYAVELTNRRF